MSKRVGISIAAVGVLLAIVGALAYPFGRELVPSALTLHAPQIGWHSVQVDGFQFLSPGRVARVTPLDYGPHTIQIELADGKAVWATFFHSDTGVDRRVDIYIACQPRAVAVAVRETITRYETFLGVTRTVFSGTVKPERTSPVNPLILDWI